MALSNIWGTDLRL